MSAPESIERQLEHVIAMLRSIQQQGYNAEQHLMPWQEHYIPPPSHSGRISATDRLSWWFRPASESDRPWDNYFDQSALISDIESQELWSSPPSLDHGSPANAAQPAQSLPADLDSALMRLRLVLAEPEDELIDEDAEAVVTCLYDFIHAIGRRDIKQAMTWVSPDYHTLEEDREIDRLGLRHRLKNLLDSLMGWEFDISLVEVPQPILHPEAILVYAEIQIDAYDRQNKSYKMIHERRLAVFTRQADGVWLISALSPI